MPLKSYRKEAEALLDRRARRALDNAMSQLMSDANPVTPKDTGALRESAGTNPARSEGNTLTAEGGYTAPYATIVHEKTWSNPTTPGTYPKWLERTALANQGAYLKAIADDIKNG